MMVLMFAVLMLSFTSAFFFGQYTYSTIDHTFTALNMTLPNLWISSNDDTFNRPMYNTQKVETTSIEHFSSNFKGVIESYKVGFYYFDAETLVQTEDNFSTGVRISLKVTIPFGEDFNKAYTFTIKEQK